MDTQNTGTQNLTVISDDVYETDSLVSQYLEFHYGSQYLGVDNFPKKCAEICIEVCKKNSIPMNKALDLGCAVGRSTFELAKEFKEAVGMDLSSKFIKNALFLKQQGKIRYSIQQEGNIMEEKETDFKSLGFEDTKDRVSFSQQDASIIDLKKYNGYDLVFAGNLVCRMKYPKKFLEYIHEFLNVGGVFIMTSPYTWLPDWTDEKDWIGGVKENGENFTSYAGLQRELKAHFVEIEPPRDVEFVIRETKRKYQHTFSQATFWKKVSN